MSQELQYLRDELNRRVEIFYCHSPRTLNHIFVVWSIIFSFCGIMMAMSAALDFAVSPIFFLSIGIVFFLSSVQIYFAILKGHNNLDQIFRIASYIAVFYEKRPSPELSQMEEKNPCWEIATFQIHAKKATADTRARKRLYEMGGEGKVFLFLSILGIIISILFSVPCIFFSKDGYFALPHLKDSINIAIFLALNIVALFTSVGFFVDAKKRQLLRPSPDLKKNHIIDFLEYALETGHYTGKEIEKRFGWNTKTKVFEY